MFDFFFFSSSTQPSDPHPVEEGPYTWAEVSAILNQPGTIPAMLHLRTLNPPPLGAYYLPRRLREPRYFIRWRAAGKGTARCEEKKEEAGTGKRARKEEEVFDEKAALRAREDRADVVRVEEGDGEGVFDEKAALCAQERAEVVTALPTPKRQRSLARAGERLPAWMRSPAKPRREFTVVRRGRE